MARARLLPLLAAAVLVIQIAEPVPALHAPAHAQQDQGLSDPGEEQAFSRALELLLQESQAQNVDTVFTMREQAAPRGGCPLIGTVYWGYARRGTICFTRQISGEGWTFDVRVLSGVNPLENQSNTSLATLAEQRAASGASEGEGDDFRNLVDDSAIDYPFAYERVVSEFDSSRAGDFIVMPNHLADKGGSKGAHGHLGQVQSRATFLIAGRGARRSPLSTDEEAGLGVQHVDIAPTVAKALGVNPYFEDTGQMARTLNGEPSTTALLERQDGEVLEELLEPVFNTIVLSVDGLDPANPTNMSRMPNLSDLIDDTPTKPGDNFATVYQQARGIMVSETNSNHTAMVTGAYGEGSGVVANNFYDRQAGASTALDDPQLNLAETLFDRIEAEAPWLRTAGVFGKEKLRQLFDAGGTHVAPDVLAGATSSPSDPNRDCPAEPGSGSGYTSAVCTTDALLDVLSKDDPDFTFVNLPMVDATSHVTGPDSPAAIAAVVEADQQIKRVVDYLKASGKWQHSTVIVTSDHSFGSQLTALPTNTINLSTVLAASGVSSTDYRVVTHGGSASVFLTNPANESQAKALQDAADAHPNVVDALYRLPNSLDGGPAGTIDAVHPNWNLGGTERIGEILLTTDDDHTFVASQPGTGDVILGEHGHPSDRHVPFVVMSGGNYVRDISVGAAGSLPSQGDDTAAFPEQAEAVDIAPTIAWILGVGAPAQSQGRILNGPTDAFAKSPAQAQADGDITEPIANRAAIFIYDQNNSALVNCLVRETTCPPDKLPAGIQGPGFVPNLEKLAGNGTLMRYGSVASFPSVTFPNHNTIGSGAHPGHHDIANNRFYVRETKELETPIDPMSLDYPLYHFSAGLLSQDVETLHEAVHRTYGEWDVGDGANSPDAFTASVNEPSVRGADFATLEPIDTEDGTAQDEDAHPSYPNPQTYAPTVNPADLLQDTDPTCAVDEGYFTESNLDNLGQTQARRLYDSNVQNGHPIPKYLINNFTLTDGAGHGSGPGTSCSFAAYKDNDARLGRILGAMGDAGVLGETLIVVTGDHAGENQAAGRKGQPSDIESLLNSPPSPIEHVMADWQVYLRTVDIEASHTSFTSGQATTVTFTVTDDDLNADGTTRPVEGALVSVDYGAGSVPGITDAAGQVTLDLTPATDTIMVTVSHPDFNTRQRGFGPQGPIDQGTAAAPGFGGGVGGLCPGLENVLGLHIVGSAGADKLTGTPGREVMCGGGGNDSVDARGGNDFVTGGNGDDLISPGAGDDDAFGQDGTDTLDYSDATARITVDLGAGKTSGSGNDTIGGFQSVRGGRAADVLRGDAEANLLTGNKGRDRLAGIGGKDRLSGGPGKDRLRGGRGKDRLRGGPGRDTCKGGPGKDKATSCGRK